MQSSISDLESLTSRVESLEKQYCSLKSEVVTERLVLMDVDGKTRATLRMSEGGPGLALYDADGKKRLTLTVDKWGPNLALFNANGNPDVAVTTLEDGPSVNLSDPANASGNTCVRLQVDRNGPILLCVKEGKVLWSAVPVQND